MRTDGLDQDTHPSLRYFIGDVRDQDRLTMAMRDVDAVVHAAALSSPLKKALLTGFHSTAKHNATKAVSPSSETMRTI